MLPENESGPVLSDTAENPSHEMDMVPFFSEVGAMAEMETTAIQGILEASEIPFTVSGNSALPVTEFVVSVPRAYLEQAKRVLAEAQAAGPAAAEQAEREGELAGDVAEIG